MKKLLFFLPLFLQALPTGGAPVRGEVSFAPQEVLLEIAASDRSIIDWDAFSIEAGETVRFIQPSSLSCVLNRVHGAPISRIDGVLEANGQVWIVNPNGLIVGKSGKIDAGAFLASTYSIAEEAFANGHDLLLQGSSVSSILVEGEIRAKGAVVLAALQIDQCGLIECAKAALAAGKEILIQTPDDPQIAIRPSKEKLLAEWGIRHEGKTSARELSFASDGNLYALAINLGGIADGEVAQVKAEGGTIEQRGKLTAPRSIDLSSRTLALFPESVLSSDAKGEGGGGRVAIQAETALLSGSIFARGARPIDPGGTIEIRAPALDLQGTLSTCSPEAANGSLLLESGSLVLGRETAPNRISARKISALLHAGHSLSIAAQELALEEPIVWQGTSSLSIRTAQNLRISSLLEQKGNGSISLHSDATLALQSEKNQAAVRSAQGELLFQAKDLLLKGGEAPAEILGGGKNVSIILSRNWESPEGAVRVIGQGDASLSIDAGGNFISAASLEIGSDQTLALRIGGSAQFAKGTVSSGRNCFIDVGGNLDCGEGTPLFQSRGGALEAASRRKLSGAASFLALSDLSIGTEENLALESSRFKSSSGKVRIRSAKNLQIKKSSLESTSSSLCIDASSLTLDESSLKASHILLIGEETSLAQSRAFASRDIDFSGKNLIFSNVQIESSNAARFKAPGKMSVEKGSKIQTGTSLSIDCGDLFLEPHSEISSSSASVLASGALCLNGAEWSAQEALRLASRTFSASESSLKTFHEIFFLQISETGAIQNSLIDGKKGVSIEALSFQSAQSQIVTMEGGFRFAIKESLDLQKGTSLSCFRNLEAHLGSLKMEEAKIKMKLGDLSIQCAGSAQLAESEIASSGKKAFLSAGEIGLDRSKIFGVNHIHLLGAEKVSLHKSELQSFQTLRVASDAAHLNDSLLKAPSIDLESKFLSLKGAKVSAGPHLGLKTGEMEISGSLLTSDTTEINGLD